MIQRRKDVVLKKSTTAEKKVLPFLVQVWPLGVQMNVGWFEIPDSGV